jgi:hypothetical protein
MNNKTKTFWFEAKVIAFVTAIPLVPILFFVGCAYFDRPQVHYYKIQRLNINGEVQQTFYSTGYPWGTDGFVSFKEYPSSRWIKMQCPYVAEDIGTNKPSIK